MPQFGENWDESEFPPAYLITIRTYGTWLHGDERGSVDTHGRFNRYGALKRQVDEGLRVTMFENMTDPKFLLNLSQRNATEAAIKEVCLHRGYDLHAVNARPSHAHAVVHANCKPEPIANAFKSYATRRMREQGLVGKDERIWSRGRSRRYLWAERAVSAAVDYVLYCQGDEEFDVWAEANGIELLSEVKPPDRHAP